MKLKLKAHMSKKAFAMDLLVQIQGNRSFQGIQKAFLTMLKNRKVALWYDLFLRQEGDHLQEATRKEYAEPRCTTSLLNSLEYFSIFRKDPNIEKLLAVEVGPALASYEKSWDGLVEFRFLIAELLSTPEVAARAYEFLLRAKNYRNQGEKTAAKYLKFLQNTDLAWSSWFNAMGAFDGFLVKEDSFLRGLAA